ncbi:MAG: endonuclease III domain-containing protein [Candidatus Omnitrophica bacterium]|nr:endonuclease III domain-containing protein [Candidatus Omnitrophota bacterium]
MVGALLTQNTAWSNVEQAIGQLTRARALSPKALARARPTRLQRLIRSSGYFRQKAAVVQGFSRWYLSRYRGSPRMMFRVPLETLRRELLAVKGIGPETADSILLYAGRQPIVVIDAYTRRIFRRHHLIEGGESYDQLQRFVTQRLPRDVQLYNEFHALLVAVGKRYCRRRDPHCAACPLGVFPHQGER